MSSTATRPSPGAPRPYVFPSFERGRLRCGAELLSIHVANRPLVDILAVIRNGAADEPAEVAGSTVLAARALSEGTERFNAIELAEAAERLGASIHAEAGWDAMTAGIAVPVERLRAAVDLLAELIRRPVFPEREVERLRDQRLNDILQAKADPRRRVEEAFIGTIFSERTPYHRPAGGTAETVGGLMREDLRLAYARGIDPSRVTFVAGGDLSSVDVAALLDEAFDGWTAEPTATPGTHPVSEPAGDSRIVRLIHRPGSVQSEIRTGHVGLPRRIEDYHAVVVMTSILGGLFNSRLNMNLRESKGYTYGAHAGFDYRRAAGPFAARAAVNTEVTIPSIREMFVEIERIREEPVTQAELDAARDYLIGVFPLRFETPGALVSALASLSIHGLPDDELSRYRERIAAVSAEDVMRAAREHIHPNALATVVVGDADAIASELEAADFGPVEVIREAVETPPVSLEEAAEEEEPELGPEGDSAE